MANLIGQNLAHPLPTPFDGDAPGPVAWAIRVRPGSYRVALRFLETPDGISAMALSHADAPALFPDMAVAPPQQNLQVAAQAAQAAQAQIAAGQGGDDDPLVFPGQPLARLSDYVRLMKGMQTGDMDGALRRAGLTMAGYGAAAQAWGMRMASDPVLTAKFSAMFAKP